MTNLFDLIIHPANLPYTVLLGVILIYWFTVVLGVLDLDFLDIDIDADADLDVDVDVDVDVDADTDVSVSPGGFTAILSFLHIGKVPFMLYMSVLVIVFWANAMFVSVFFPPTNDTHFWIWLAPIVFTGLLLTKGLTYPLVKVHSKLNDKATRSRDLVGKTCEIVTTVNPSGYGQAEITHNDQHFLLTVFSNEQTPISRQSNALIIGYDAEKEAYEVSAL
jgi:hypothetical protein